MAGETDLDSMLADLEVVRRPGTFCFLTVDEVPSTVGVEALVTEDEATSIVLDTDLARSRGVEVDLELAWLTLRVHSSLEAVGLTAIVSARLASAGIPCNMLAGFYHDHVLVPADRAAEAMAAVVERTGTRSSCDEPVES